MDNVISFRGGFKFPLWKYITAGASIFNFLIKFIHSFITFEKNFFKALLMTLFLTKVGKNITQVIIPYIHT